MNLFLITIVVLILNIPFGYWRTNVKRFSVQWFLSIHLPIPFIILLRIYSGIGFEFITYPVLITAFFAGQFAGKVIFDWRMKNNSKPLSSCLVMDLIRVKK